MLKKEQKLIGSLTISDRISESVISKILNKIYIDKKPLTWRQNYILKAYAKQNDLREHLITHLENNKGKSK